MKSLCYALRKGGIDVIASHKLKKRDIYPAD